jgi:hypothetical protein
VSPVRLTKNCVLVSRFKLQDARRAIWLAWRGTTTGATAKPSACLKAFAPAGPAINAAGPNQIAIFANISFLPAKQGRRCCRRAVRSSQCRGFICIHFDQVVRHYFSEIRMSKKLMK